MSARDDYPYFPNPRTHAIERRVQYDAMCDEIDRLRAYPPAPYPKGGPMTDHATPSLLERLQNLSPKARCLLATEPDWIMIPVADPDTPNEIVGVLTTSPDEADGYVIGVYDRDAWTSGIPDAVLPVPTRYKLLQGAEYLLRYWPEGTDWSAWACQRIADDGDTLGER